MLWSVNNLRCGTAVVKNECEFICSSAMLEDREVDPRASRMSSPQPNFCSVIGSIMIKVVVIASD